MIELLRLFSLQSAPDDPPPDARRRPPRACDDAINGTTRGWLRRLPAGRRPLQLCCRYPRVANRIAWCWRDPLLLDQVFEDLLVDRRGGRQGFPRAVVQELRRLRDLSRS
jgi:hypothetical protein